MINCFVKPLPTLKYVISHEIAVLLNFTYLASLRVSRFLFTKKTLRTYIGTPCHGLSTHKKIIKKFPDKEIMRTRRNKYTNKSMSVYTNYIVEEWRNSCTVATKQRRFLSFIIISMCTSKHIYVWLPIQEHTHETCIELYKFYRFCTIQ